MIRIAWCSALLLLGLGLSYQKTSAQENGTGLEFDPEEYLKQPAVATMAKRDRANLPKRVSLRQYCPVPGDQGKHGTCTSWATAYHARTMLEAIRKKRVGASANTREAFSPSFVYNQIRSRPGCQSGTSTGSAMALLRSRGALKASVLKFDCGFTDWKRYYDIAEPFKIYDYLRLHDPFSNNKVLPVKKALSQGQPVVCGMHIVKSFFQIRNKTSGLFMPTAAEKAIKLNKDFFLAKKYNGHAMVVVGYDDSKGDGGSFEIINSWGPGWGDKGYCWVSYADFNRFASHSYSMIGYPDYKSDLAGGLLLETDKGERMAGKYVAGRRSYKLAKKYPPKTRFRIYLKNDKPIYLYAFGFDQTGKTFKLFPHSETSSAYIPYKKSHIPIPDDDHYIEIDEQQGRNDLCVIYSMKKLPIDDLMKVIDKDGKKLVTGRFTLRSVVKFHLEKLGHKSVPHERTKYSEDDFHFSSKRISETCVPVVIEFGN